MKTAVMLLALTMFGEARSEGELGMRAIGHVVMNRVEAEEARFGRTIEQVVWKPGQFSCWRDGNRKAMRKVHQLPEGTRDAIAWAKAKRLAARIAAGKDRDPTKGALYFHAEETRPSWAKRLKRVASAAGLHFYKQRAA